MPVQEPAKPPVNAPDQQRIGDGQCCHAEAKRTEEAVVENAHRGHQPLHPDCFKEKINENRVHAHHHEGEGPAAFALHVNQPVKKRQCQQCPAARCEDEGRGGNPLDDGREARPVQPVADGQPDDACHHQRFCPSGMGQVGEQQPAADGAPDGVRRRGHAVEGDPTAAVVEFAHQQHVHGAAEVLVHDEWRRRSVGPVAGFGDGQQQQRCAELHPPVGAHEQEGDGDGEGELRQHVPQLEDELAAVNTVQPRAEEEEQQAPPEDVAQALGPSIAFGQAAFQRKRHGHAHDEHEKRLNQVPEAQPRPRVVVELLHQPVQPVAFRECLCQRLVHQGSLPGQQEHGDAPKGIER